ncbi:Protein kinase C-binding protein 1 [Folsomia candida]|uniref:Protein kinase C-binding protein 1 n=1 Tax=Folsomia candida TaxID=158441 RepID=A0A226EV92_FOLCA|nr:Protein kinase C-binding protein 1 [Folsomia candida]
MASSSLPSPFSETTLGLISPTSIPPFKRDLYCWVCHVDGPLLKCKTCSRAYHRNCANQLGSLCHTAEALMDTESPSPHFMKGCPECQMGTKTIFPNMKQAPIQELRLICVAIARNLRDGYFWPNPFYKLDTEKSPKEFQEYKDIVAKVVDISELEKLAGNDQFVTLEGFLGEAKWILHNTIIVHGKCSREADCAKEIIDICELELLAAELCPECFLKEHNREKDELWFIKPCLVIEN